LLNPANYPEDEDASAFYNPTGSYEADDLSDEWIDFPSYQDDLATLIEGLPEGDITDPEVLQSVLDQSGSNDALIVRQEIDYEETALYHDLKRVYYAFNNFPKTERYLKGDTPTRSCRDRARPDRIQDAFDDAYTAPSKSEPTEMSFTRCVMKHFPRQHLGRRLQDHDAAGPGIIWRSLIGGGGAAAVSWGTDDYVR
jgi:hypothetical protein